ncbi:MULTISPECIES: SirB1 family protein [Pseudomonas]|jgi:regulator of sirC expression with transglutaminase-like and TPR domain|uniref:SirB1 family protein n=1 Tax=Pseudomonas TaxID=286 RepID=UPI000DA88648|nr:MULTISPECIES: transglutaminase family protein [Pseudomonas]MDW3713094.1 tetratricopeptide repeat protein [Pseudomonas sp. 2023EL-01195]PZE14559.1 hypothetical protein DMX10_04985 [Pseudomonas sp. 57B-090624]
MTPRQHCLACLEADPPATLEAAFWIAAEHEPAVNPVALMRDVAGLAQQVAAGLPQLPAVELAQPLLRRLSELDFNEDDDQPLRPRAALLDQVLLRRRGQPLSLALLALELARRLDVPLVGVNFPGHFLLRVPGADHLLDPCGGRRLYTRDCRELLLRNLGPKAELQAGHLQPCTPREQLQRLSRNLRQLHLQAEKPLEALKDAERVLELGTANLVDHLSRADIYKQLECPQAERFDLQHALLLCEDPAQRLLLTQRLEQLGQAAAPALH